MTPSFLSPPNIRYTTKRQMYDSVIEALINPIALLASSVPNRLVRPSSGEDSTD